MFCLSVANAAEKQICQTHPDADSVKFVKFNQGPLSVKCK